MNILRDTNDPTWNFPFIFLFGREEPWVRATISKWNTHSLGRSHRDVGSHFTGRPENGTREDVTDDREKHFFAMELLRKLCVVRKSTEIIRILYHHSTILLGGAPVEFINRAYNKIDSECMAFRLYDLNRLWEDRV